MFQEFPKALYQGDSFRTVTDADQEAEARAAGWHDFDAPPAPAGEDGGQAASDGQAQAAEPAKRGRKAATPPAPAGEQSKD